MKRLFFFLASIAAVISCSDLETESVSLPDSLSIPVKIEDLSTRSYLVDSETQWNYTWQNGDTLKYFTIRNGQVIQSGTATVLKGNTSWSLELSDASSFKVGDVIYPYFCPSAESGNPYSVDLQIPVDQVSDYSLDTYVDVRKTTLSLTSVSLDKTSSSTTSSSSSSKVTPNSRTLKFRISGYSSSNVYYYQVGDGTSKKLSPSSDGFCSVTVTFPSMSLSTSGFRSTKTNGSTSTMVYVYIDGHPEGYTSIPVSVSGTRTSSIGWNRSYTYTYTYKLGAVIAGSYSSRSTSVGSNRLTPVRDAMPLVSKPITITQNILNGTSSVENSLSCYNLGSLIEYRIYSLAESIGVGETIESVSLTSKDAPVAGDFNYNIVSNPLTISGLTENTVISHVEDLDILVPYQKENQVSVYMVVAPGTYAASLDILTDQAHYLFDLASKTYSRSVKKPFAVNLASSTCTRVPLQSEPDEPDEPSEPEQPEQPETPQWETTYAVFASDRHGNTTAFSTATRNMPSTVPYACLIGDMVGSGGSDAPSYNSSTVRNEVTSVWSSATAQIVWGSHDAQVRDDAGIVYGDTAGSSGLIYTQKDSNGNVQYYVYGIAYYDMSVENNGQSAAAAFESWVSTISDKTIPVFVACHMPIHASRRDNYGAYYWNRALTFAATGSETGTKVERNVVFFHGHNHTNESNKEYYYAPGSTLSVARSSGTVSCTIPYTYITGGYLNANKKATLVTVEADTMTFTKYGNSSSSVLGTVDRIK